MIGRVERSPRVGPPWSVREDGSGGVGFIYRVECLQSGLFALRLPRHIGRARPLPFQIQIHVPIKRNSKFYVKYVLTPIYLLVIMAYGSLFIQRGAAPARVSLSVTCYLTLTSIVNAVQVGMRRDT